MENALPDPRRLEELTLNTAPAIHQHFHDGWVLRASGTDTRRSNAATALGPSQNPHAHNITTIERWFQRLGQPAIFRLSAELSPAGFDDALAARGYRLDAATDVMLLTPILPGSLPETPAGMRLLTRSPDEGLTDIYTLRGSSPEVVALERSRQALWRGAQTFLSIKSINGVVASGMARMDDGFVGLFNLRTKASERGKGLGTLLVKHLIAWGAGEGAHTAFLQVEQENTIAHRLYEQHGFKAVYRYWHRLPAQ